MKLDHTEEQQMIQAMPRDFAETAIKPIAAQIDREPLFPHETEKRMGDLGLIVIASPYRCAPSGADSVSEVLALQQVASSRQSHHAISALVVEKGTKGFVVPKTEDKLGIRASDTAELVFEDCRVPAANRLGEEGMGFGIALAALDGGRVGIAAQAVGLAAGALERSLAYARERKSFGVAIGQHQMVQWMLADMATAVDGARLLTLRAAALKDAGRPYGTAAAMAKLFAAETAMKVTTDAIQVHGGYGFVKEYEVERYFRDAKITQIYEGTSQIQKLVIARAVLGGTP